jgi:hypothetical protein
MQFVSGRGAPPSPRSDSNAAGPGCWANAWDAQNLTWTQLQVMAARVLELPAGETEIATTNVMPVLTDGTVE